MPVRTVAKLFGRSPFVPLQVHLEKVTECVDAVATLLDGMSSGTAGDIEQAATAVSKLEHEADLVKNDIRNSLPRGLFLAIDRGQLLEILSLQDSIADQAEDIAVQLSIKPLDVPSSLAEQFEGFVHRNIDSFHKVSEVMREVDELIESGFGGPEATRVESMIDEVAQMEHEVDVLQRDLMRGVYAAEDTLSTGEFHGWMRLLHEVGSLSNLSEKLANRVRMLLTLK